MRVAATSQCVTVDLGLAPADKEMPTADSNRQMMLVGGAFRKEAAPSLCSISQVESKTKGRSFPEESMAAS